MRCNTRFFRKNKRVPPNRFSSVAERPDVKLRHNVRGARRSDNLSCASSAGVELGRVPPPASRPTFHGQEPAQNDEQNANAQDTKPFELLVGTPEDDFSQRAHQRDLNCEGNRDPVLPEIKDQEAINLGEDEYEEDSDSICVMGPLQ